MSTPADEASRRRTFAIISHPDAGKTTLTEKFLLYGGALTNEAGAVKARQGRRSATSDWMALEQQRGISITSTVLQFPYRDHVVNLLDTPGHRDFSEDTYRVLAAADAAVMVLDAAKGIEPQTLKLFDVCRQRGLPLLTFVNKWDRPGLDPVELLDEITQKLDLEPTPVTWPVGLAGDFRGVIDRRDATFTRFTRVARGATEAPEELGAADRAEAEEGAGVDDGPRRARPARRRRVPSSTARPSWPRRRRRSSSARRSPTSACASCSTPSSTSSRRRHRATTSTACPDRSTRRSPASCSRCRPTWTRRTATASPSCACARVASSAAWSSPTARPASRSRRSTPTRCSARSARPSTRPSPATSSASSTPPTCASATASGPTSRSPSRASRASPPSTSAWPGCATPPGSSSSAEGVAQLDEEGVVQVLRDPEMGDQAPVLAAVGPMQFEVAVHRLENEFGAPVELLPDLVPPGPPHRRRRGRGAQGHARRPGPVPGRRHDPRPVREPVLGGAARARPARPAPRAPRRRRLGRLRAGYPPGPASPIRAAPRERLPPGGTAAGRRST